jgi:hypothetical protein
MAENTIGRRRMLRGAGVAVGGAAIISVGLGSPALATSKNGVAGSWMIVHRDEADPTPVTAVISFADGGVFISHDISPAGPPFTGSWKRQGGHRFSATFWSGFPVMRVRGRAVRRFGSEPPDVSPATAFGHLYLHRLRTHRRRAGVG